MYDSSSSYYDDSQQITEFELRALAFADLIETVASGATQSEMSEPEGEQRQKLPLFSTIRCICGNNENRGELIPCQVCHCYLHAGCVDKQQLKRGANFRCPFCRLQLDGVDPFKELSNWVGQIDDELKRLHQMISEAMSYENQLAAGNSLGMNDFHMMAGMGRQRQNTQLRQALQKKLSDIIQVMSSLLNL